MKKIAKIMERISRKIWGGKTPDEILSKRFKIFVLLGVLIAGLFWVYRAKAGVGFLPNFEWFIPVLVVVGSFSLPLGKSAFWRTVNRYFGVVVLISAIVFDLLLFGPGYMPIFVFRWSGFIFVWILAMRNKLSMFSRYKTLVGNTLLTTAIAILVFDIWTGIIGTPLSGWHGGAITTPAPWLAAFFGQIPFTFYHLCSLIFVPPLVGLGKLLVKVKIPVSVAVQSGAKITSGQRR